MRNLKYALAIAALVAGSAHLAAAQELRDLSVEQTGAAGVVATHPGGLSTAISADRADATYAVGETVHLTLSPSQDSFVTVLDVGPSGAVTQLFPNRFQPDSFLRAGQPVEIAGAASGANIVVGPPTGTELIKVITSNKPITVVPEAQLKGAGPFRVLEGGVQTLERDLGVVRNTQPTGDTFIAFGNFGLYTIPTRAAGAMNPVVVVPAQPSPAAHFDVPASQPFPLLLATDKTKYRIGEKATITVTTTQACGLTVLDFNAAGVVRTLYPAPGAPNAMLAANQTLFVSGGPSPEMAVAGPAGAEQILAICTAPDVAAASGSPLPPATGGDSVVIVRNLTTAAAKPGAAVASAILTILN